MTSIYLTFTPFHLITSCGIALNYSNREENFLIVFKDFQNAEIYIKAIINWRLNPFKEIYLLQGRTIIDEKPYFLKYFYTRHKILLLRKLLLNLKKRHPVNQFIFNDRTIEGQFFLKNKREYKSNNIYVDDGIESYIASNSSKFYNSILISLIRRIISKFLFGFWYKIPKTIGTSKKLNRMFSFFPDLVLDEYKIKYKFIDKITEDIFYRLNMTGLIKQISSNFNIDLSKKKSYCILLLPNTEYFIEMKMNMDDVKFFLKKIIKILDEYFDIIYLKYHPREKRLGFIDSFSDKFRLINYTIALELIFFMISSEMNSKKLLIGVKSTAFITARLIIKYNLEIVSFDKILKEKGFDQYSKVYKAFNILTPNNFKELVKLIANF